MIVRGIVKKITGKGQVFVEVATPPDVEDKRFVFDADRIENYRGEGFRDHGIAVGTFVKMDVNEDDIVQSVQSVGRD